MAYSAPQVRKVPMEGTEALRLSPSQRASSKRGGEKVKNTRGDFAQEDVQDESRQDNQRLGGDEEGRGGEGGLKGR